MVLPKTFFFLCASGEFFIYLYYTDTALPHTPFVGYAKLVGGALNHTRVMLRGHGIASAHVGEEAEFIIDGSEAGPGLYFWLRCLTLGIFIRLCRQYLRFVEIYPMLSKKNPQIQNRLNSGSASRVLQKHGMGWEDPQ